MGSGKTTVGRRLAENLKISFFDADHEIIDKTGVSIDHIFDVEGEEGFRKRESHTHTHTHTSVHLHSVGAGRVGDEPLRGRC